MVVFCKTLPPLDTVPEDFCNRLEIRGLHFFSLNSQNHKITQSYNGTVAWYFSKRLYANGRKTKPFFHLLKIFGGPGPWGTTPLNGTIGDPYDLPFRQTGGLKCTQQAMSQLSPNCFGAKHRLMSAQSGRPDINQYCLKIDWNVMS